MGSTARNFQWARRAALAAACTTLAACSSDEPPPPVAAGGSAGSGASGGAGMPSTGGAGVSGAAGNSGGSSAGQGSGAAGASANVGGMSAAGTSGVAGSPAGSGGRFGTGGRGGTAGGGAGGMPNPGGRGGSAGAPVLDPSDHSPEGTCARWNADRANMSEGTWSGSVDSCDAGDISAEGRENALRLTNLYRWLVDLPPVVTSPEKNALAQACALVMHAEGSLSHEPPEDWACWSEEGAEGAGTSNISSGPGVSSVDLYMVDTGNEDTHGHRRWILSNTLGPTGLGSTGPMGASCMITLGGEGDADKDWVAWPPAGVMPIEAVAPNRFGDTLDEVGWSIQSDSINLKDATVTITSGGMDMPVMVNELPGGYGSRYALRIAPDGWTTTAGQTYSVSVSGTSTPIAYEVTVVDCSN
jgi:hypothetical protein